MADDMLPWTNTGYYFLIDVIDYKICVIHRGIDWSSQTWVLDTFTLEKFIKDLLLIFTILEITTWNLKAYVLIYLKITVKTHYMLSEMRYIGGKKMFSPKIEECSYLHLCKSF